MLHRGGYDDLDSVMDLMTRAFRPCFGEGWTRSQCAGILPMSGVSLTLAWRGEQAVGFSLVRSVFDESELLLLAVDPDAQGQGIGRALLDDFVSSARVRGADKLHLEVRDGNSAVHLYDHAGFKVAGRRLDYYKGPDGERFDALTMVLSDRIS